MMADTLDVWLDGVLAGHLRRGAGGAVEFEYDDQGGSATPYDLLANMGVDCAGARRSRIAGLVDSGLAGMMADRLAARLRWVGVG
jgi:hypothetical protein